MEEQAEYNVSKSAPYVEGWAITRTDAITTKTINEYAQLLLDKGVFLNLSFWTSFLAMLWLIFVGYVPSDLLHWGIIAIVFVCGLTMSIVSYDGKKVGNK